MPKPRTKTGEKNLISQRLIELRREKGLSQRDLAENCSWQAMIWTRM